jgi:hypothetical protein
MPLRRATGNTRSAKRRALAQDLSRAAIVTFVLVGAGAVTAIAGIGWQISSPPKKAAVRSASVAGNGDLTTGSVVFVPTSGDICRQSEIDNATWQIRQVGEVPCQQALSAAAHKDEPGAGTRIAIIRNSFRKATP